VDFTTLQTFPAPPPRETPEPERRWRINSRVAWRLFHGTWAVCIVCLLVYLRHTSETIRNPPQPAPLEFKVVAEQFEFLRVNMPRQEVYALLGPENYTRLREPEFAEFERIVDIRPERYPGLKYWAKWADPANQDRWVAIFIAGDYVHRIIKKGF
jgi:hypothetical protein